VQPVVEIAEIHWGHIYQRMQKIPLYFMYDICWKPSTFWTGTPSHPSPWTHHIVKRILLMENNHFFCFIGYSHPCALLHRVQVDFFIENSFKERLQFFFIKNQRSSMSVFYFPIKITNVKIKFLVSIIK